MRYGPLPTSARQTPSLANHQKRFAPRPLFSRQTRRKPKRMTAVASRIENFSHQSRIRLRTSNWRGGNSSEARTLSPATCSESVLPPAAAGVGDGLGDCAEAVVRFRQRADAMTNNAATAGLVRARVCIHPPCLDHGLMTDAGD